ncbi:hypothetical protein C8R46DRAFT_1219687 [Mycena filopes]|nr:hypothetical protein C8R46DRAFT_1219687 [Mycena filopes]
MDSDDEYITMTDSNKPTLASHGAGIFTGSHHFTVAGGTFTNTINNNVAPAIPDLRMIPWGDIDLQQKLLVNKETGAIGYLHERKCVRRVYSAKVDGQRSDVTVAVYQGDGAEDTVEWREVEDYVLSAFNWMMVHLEHVDGLG